LLVKEMLEILSWCPSKTELGSDIPDPLLTKGLDCCYV